MTRKKKILIAIPTLLIIWLIVFCIQSAFYRPTLPKNTSVQMLERETVDTNFYACNNSWLLRNDAGLWEMYVEGDALHRGSVTGALAKDLIRFQEEAFVKQIYEMIPSKSMVHFLRMFIGIYNRNLGDYINEEYKEEIYAESKYASSEYNYIGNPYQRMLNYHGAHDIGHAVQVMGFVGCSAIGVWDNYTADSLLLLGRNFDFYVGDDFAKNKMVVFMNPTSGYKHAFISWGGMMGVVSGMNEHGLAIVLNAAPTDIPLSSATPVSIVAREILQYARNIDEAVAIANKRKTFVSEQFIIASAADRKTISIEKKPEESAVYSIDDNYLICTNHFQSPGFFSRQVYNETASGYRHDRMEELLMQQYPVISGMCCSTILCSLADSLKKEPFTPENMVRYLRDIKGKSDADIGLGNEKSINQLIAHHSVVFQPETHTMWVSTAPFQCGEFIAYNLDSIFNLKKLPSKQGVSNQKQKIAADTAFINNQIKTYTAFKSLLKVESTDVADSLIKLNPNYFYTYEHIGNLYFDKKEYKQAEKYYFQALQKEISNKKEKDRILGQIEDCKKKATK